MRATAKAASRLVGAMVLGVFFFAMMVNTLIIAQGLTGPIHVVEGNSMAPNIMASDGVILARTSPGSLQPGQVVVFFQPLDPSTQIVHRIVGIERRGENTYLKTKGDGNPEADPFMVPEENVSGRVAMRLPEVGGFLAFVHTTLGYLVTVLFPIIIAVLYVFVRIMREKLLEADRLALVFSSDLLCA